MYITHSVGLKFKCVYNRTQKMIPSRLLFIVLRAVRISQQRKITSFVQTFAVIIPSSRVLLLGFL